MFRRGFKAEAERIAAETRRELDLDATDPLVPVELAKHLEIPVYKMSDLGTPSEVAAFVGVFSGVEQESFSAVTVFIGGKRFIVHNESHAPTRQASNLSHEISHCILEHEPTPHKSNGRRHWDKAVEEEATWLGAALLVPRDGALKLAKRGFRMIEIASNYGVSESLCVWRLRQTGVIAQLVRLQQLGAGR